MKINPLLAAFVIFSGVRALAYPSTVDSTRRPVPLIADTVEILIGKDISQVNALYKFRQENNSRQEKRVAHVRIFIPFLLPENAEADYVRQHGFPIVSIDGVPFERRMWNDFPREVDLTANVAGLPRGWSLIVYQYDLPVRALKKEFTVSVSYAQVNFPGSVVAYVPIHPPKEKDAALVTFHAPEGVALKAYKRRFFFQKSFPKLEFIPRDRKLIRVQIVRGKPRPSFH